MSPVAADCASPCNAPGPEPLVAVAGFVVVCDVAAGAACFLVEPQPDATASAVTRIRARIPRFACPIADWAVIGRRLGSLVEHRQGSDRCSCSEACSGTSNRGGRSLPDVAA